MSVSSEKTNEISLMNVFSYLFRRIRRQITTMELKRAARKPWRQLKTKADDLQVVVLD